MSNINLAILDIQKSFYQGLTCVIKTNHKNLTVSGCFSSSIDLINKNLPILDVLIMDLGLEDGNGLEKIKFLKGHYPKSKILIYSAYIDSKYVKEAFQLGADGFVSKYNVISDLITGISQVLKGETYLSKGLRITPAASVFKKVFKTKTSKPQLEDKYQIQQKLTPREIEVLNLIVQAKSNKAIGNELFISDQTVGVHRKNIMRKLNTRSTINLIKYAFENQLV